MHSEKFKHLISLTIRNIIRRKARSILTVVSVIIGITAVIALILLSNGLLNAVESQFDAFGLDTLFIMPMTYGGGVFGGEGPPDFSSRTAYDQQLKIKDAENIQKLAEVDKVYYFSYKMSTLEYRNEEKIQLNIMMPAKDFDDVIDVMGIDLREGKTIQGQTSRKVVIGPYLAEKMFSRKIDVGDKLKIDGHDFRVVGILEPVGNVQDDSQLYTTREVGVSLFGIDDRIEQIIVTAKENQDIDAVKNAVEKRLEKDYEEDSFAIFTSQQILDIIQSVLSMLTIVLVAIALISVVVGSIGIMNSIYTSVLERIGEIGILKSIGAKVSDIIFLFLIESVVLSLIGGIIGLGFGYGIAKLVEWYAMSKGFDMLVIVITPNIILLAIGLSLFVGIISGIFPSKKAAKLKPVDALRNIY
jgi:putative ABC transport system permease protein